jgi:hypothetical protein
MFGHEPTGEYEAAAATAADSAGIGERFGDRDLLVLAVHSQDIFLVKQWRVVEGLRLLDKAMVADRARSRAKCTCSASWRSERQTRRSSLSSSSARGP